MPTDIQVEITTKATATLAQQVATELGTATLTDEQALAKLAELLQEDGVGGTTE